MNIQLTGHKHGPAPPPDNAGEFAANAGMAVVLAAKLRPITG